MAYRCMCIAVAIADGTTHQYTKYIHKAIYM